MKRPSRTRPILALLAIVVLLAGGVWFMSQRDQPGSSSVNGASTEPAQQEYDISSADSVTVVVNKRRPLPDTYEPANLVTPDVPLRLAGGQPEMQLRQEAAHATEELFAGAKAAGHDLMLASAYRSQAYQENLYNYYVSQRGQAVADTESARPGYSEHHTGLAVDIGRPDRYCELLECFEETPEGQWLATHAPEYGFIMRYLPGKDAITGYVYEPWHFRYVGKDLAQKVAANDQTLEEYFGLPAAPNYQ